MRLRQLKALDDVAGAWKDKDHPELKDGAAKWGQEVATRERAQIRYSDRQLNIATLNATTAITASPLGMTDYPSLTFGAPIGAVYGQPGH